VSVELDRLLKVRQAVRVVCGAHGADVAATFEAECNFALSFPGEFVDSSAEFDKVNRGLRLGVGAGGEPPGQAPSVAGRGPLPRGGGEV
jgi:hypothetical protein